MSYWERTNDFDDARPPLEFGIEWDHTVTTPATCCTRIGDAATLAVDTTLGAATYAAHDSDYNDYFPWAGMKRYYFDLHGDIIGAVGETGISFTEAANRVLVRIPYFWYKVEQDTPSANKWRYWVSPYPLKGYRIHPAFLRYSTQKAAFRITDVHVGAYEAYTASLAQYSVSNQSPKISYSRSSFRTLFEALGPGSYHNLDWKTYHALCLLYLVEYACPNSQAPSGSAAKGGLSEGIVRTGTNTAGVQKTGWTSSTAFTVGAYSSYDLGNLSGQVQCDITGAAAPVWAMSFHGIENLWGNTWTLVDGMNAAATTRYFYIPTLDVFLDTLTGSYWKTGFLADAGASNIMKYPGTYAGIKEGDWMFGNWVMGGSTSTHVADSYDAPADFSVIRVPAIGNSYQNVLNGGIFSVSLYNAIAGTGTDTGARIMNIPLDQDFWSYRNR